MFVNNLYTTAQPESGSSAPARLKALSGADSVHIRQNRINFGKNKFASAQGCELPSASGLAMKHESSGVSNEVW